MENDMQTRHEYRIRRMRKRRRIRRMVFLLAVMAATIIICMYNLPFFDVSEVEVNGNKKLSVEEIAEKSGIKGGENIFLLNKKDICGYIGELPYTEKVSMKRRIFPTAAVVLTISEREPAACIKIENSYIVIDKDAVVLENLPQPIEGITQFEGIKVSSYKLGKQFEAEDVNYIKDIMLIVKSIAEFEGRDKMSPISFEDISNISFYYDTRLKIICGSVVDFDRKMSMLDEVLHSDNITDKSRGTLDLRIIGKATYTP